MVETATSVPKPKKKHGCLIALAVLLFIFIALSVFLEFAVPARVEALIGDRLQQDLKTKEKPVVQVSMHPLLYKLIVGRIDSVYVKIRNVDVKNGLVVDSAEAFIKGISFDPVRIIRTRQPSVKSIDEGQIKVVLSEKAVNDLVGGQLPGSHVKLVKGRVLFTGDLSYILSGFTYAVSGTVAVQPDNTLSFRPVPESVAGLPVPQELKDYLKNALTIDYRTNDLPDGVTIGSLTITPGKMTIEASVDSLDSIIQKTTGGG